jgi:hypothetical protein
MVALCQSIMNAQGKDPILTLIDLALAFSAAKNMQSKGQPGYEL